MTGLYAEVFRLLRPFWPLTLFATLAGAAGGIATAWLLATINRGLQAGEITTGFVLAFLGLCGVTLAGGAIAGVGNSLIGQRVVAALRKDISARILSAPIAALEQTRHHRLMATLNQDIDAFSVFTFSFSGYATAFAIMLGCIAYMLLLSPILFLLAVLAIAGGMSLNRYARRRWLVLYQGVSTAQDELQKQYRAITDGAKELRIHRPRRMRVFGTRLSDAADRIANHKIAAMRLHWLAETGSGALFFLAIGAMLLLRPSLGIDTGVVTGFVITMLYVRGPISQVASGIPSLLQAQVAFRRIAELMAQFTNPEPRILAGGRPVPRAISSLTLRGIGYRYPGKEGFAIGPVDLDIHAGELVFIVGDNGSGKTTLVKLLLGLYAPQQGEILLDGVPVTDVTRDDYRQVFTTIFADYFLFDDLATAGDTLPPEAAHYLERLGLAHKVRIENGAFSTTDLSTGQRKRLALVQAWLEGRPVLVFDEWAADQDPSFRHTFYTELLPALREQGRTLIVISHDDRYFHVADRVLRLDAGRIAAEERPVQDQTP